MALYLNVHVQTVVEIAEPEQMRESQRDVEGVQLFIAQRQLTQDVQIVLVAPARGQRSLVLIGTAAKQTMNRVFDGRGSVSSHTCGFFHCRTSGDS